LNGSGIRGNAVLLSANASDDIAVAGVKFYINGVLFGSEDTSSPYQATFDSTSRTDGSYSIVAAARDTSSNYATSTAATVTIDNTAPVVSDIRTTPSANGVVIRWTTNEPASSQIAYGLSSSYGTLSAEQDSSARVTSHAVSLSGLVSCSTYHFTASSTDAVLNSGVDGDNAFTTRGCAGDANVRSQISHVISRSTGGSASLVGTETLSLAVPVSYGGADAQFQIKELEKTTALDGIGAPAASKAAVGQVFDLHALTATDTAQSTFGAALTITLSYSAADIVGLVESSLKMYRNDDGVWTQLSNCTVDTVLKTVTCDTDHFSTFAIFGDAQASAPATVQAEAARKVGGNVRSRVNNLVAQGKVNDAQALMRQWPSLFASAAATSTSTPRDLEFGMTGSDVLALQRVLISQNAGPAAQTLAKKIISGYYGVYTRAAVVEYQTKAGILPASGKCGPRTRAYLKAHVQTGLWW
jgi:hypothetical protein